MSVLANIKKSFLIEKPLARSRGGKGYRHRGVICHQSRLLEPVRKRFRNPKYLKTVAFLVYALQRSFVPMHYGGDRGWRAILLDAGGDFKGGVLSAKEFYPRCAKYRRRFAKKAFGFLT